jgi:hypothetical protein
MRRLAFGEELHVRQPVERKEKVSIAFVGTTEVFRRRSSPYPADARSLQRISTTGAKSPSPLRSPGDIPNLPQRSSLPASKYAI